MQVLSHVQVELSQLPRKDILKMAVFYNLRQTAIVGYFLSVYANVTLCNYFVWKKSEGNQIFEACHQLL